MATISDNPRLNKLLLEKLAGSSNIPALDAVRGLAALMVIVAHTFGPRQLGSMAVTVFFVLSGFLITWLLVKESEKTGRISLRDFYIRRTLRIFPAFYVFWFVCIGAAALRGAHILWGQAWASFFYVGDYYDALIHRPGGIMGITWSLGVEEKFYLLWPFIFAALHRNPKKLLRVALFAIGAIWLYRIVLTLTVSLPPDYLRYAFESRFDNILYGCVLALGLKLRKVEPILKTGASIPVIPMAIVGSLLGLCFLEERLGSAYLYVFGMSLNSLLIAIALLQFVYLGAVGGWKWLSHPILRFFGRISYSLYLYHIVVIAMIQHYFPALRIRYAYPAIYVGSIAAAYLSFHLVEQPFLHLKERFAPGGHSPQPVMPSQYEPSGVAN